MLFRRGDLVESIPDSKWGTVETVACGGAGCRYGVRFADGEAAVRTPEQLHQAGPQAVRLGSTAATQAGNDASKLTDDMLALKKVIEVKENYDKIMAADPAFVASFEKMLQGWDRFLKQASGQNIAWYNLPGKVSRSFWVVFEGKSLFNTTQDYRKKYNEHNYAVEKILGKQPLPYRPEAPKAPKEDKSPTEALAGAMDKLVTGALIVGGVVGGGYLLLRVLGK